MYSANWTVRGVHVSNCWEWMYVSGLRMEGRRESERNGREGTGRKERRMEDWKEGRKEGRRVRCTGVSCLTRVGHQIVLVQTAGFVVGGLEDGDAAHGRFGRGDDGEVFARDAE